MISPLRIVTLNHVSNVTCVVTPMSEINILVHEENSFICWDCATACSHEAPMMNNTSIHPKDYCDALFMSPHKMIGGVGSCGRGLCCSTWLSDFEPVSIKMAKVQNLSLNPSKISGMCGRLMCCLKFENEVYTHLKKGMPAVGERIKTPDGMAIVSDVNILENIIKTRLVLDNGKKDENGEEKLSTEFYNYGKEEIKRINKKHGHGGHKKKEKEDDLAEIEGDLLKEIKELMKD